MASELFISAASAWEVAIKVGIGKLDVSCGDVVAGINGSGFVELPVLSSHVALAAELPRHRRDPFDRLLVAQAMSEPARLLTADSALQRCTELVDVV